MNEAELLVSKTNQYLDLYTESVRSLFRIIRLTPNLDPEFLYDLAYDASLIVEAIYFLPFEGEPIASKSAEFLSIGNDFSSTGIDLSTLGPELRWSDAHQSPISGRTVTFVQKFPQSAPNPGICIMEIQLDLLNDNIIGLINRKGITLHVGSRNNHTILYDLMGVFTFPIGDSQIMSEILARIPKGRSELEWNGTEYHLIRSQSNQLGWSVLAFVDPDFFSSGLAILNRQFLTLGSILLVLIVASSMVLSLIISRPVRELASVMDQVRSLKHIAPISHTYRNEFSVLVDAYNNMMNRITRLTYEKNEFEWKMLQSQIGPHFLYNTLACIGAMAKRNRTSEITWTIDSLVHLLKYSFDRTASDVTLKEELKVVQSFVAIQNIRFGDLCTLKIDVDEETGNVLVPALLLQPIIENSIFHGLVPENQKGLIRIVARTDFRNLVISIHDNGKGIPEAQLATLRSQIEAEEIPGQNLEQHPDSVSSRLHAIGLWNIQRRLHVHYGPQYGLEVESTPETGTRVHIILPIRRSYRE